MQNRAGSRAVACRIFCGTTLLVCSGLMIYVTIEAVKETIMSGNACHPSDEGGTSCSSVTMWGYDVLSGVTSLVFGVCGFNLVKSGIKKMGFFAEHVNGSGSRQPLLGRNNQDVMEEGSQFGESSDYHDNNEETEEFQPGMKR